MVFLTPAQQVHELPDWGPDEDAPVSMHVAWHERRAEVWDRIVECDCELSDNARWIVGYHRRMAKELLDQQPEVGWRRDDHEA